MDILVILVLLEVGASEVGSFVLTFKVFAVVGVASVEVLVACFDVLDFMALGVFLVVAVKRLTETDFVVPIDAIASVCGPFVLFFKVLNMEDVVSVGVLADLVSLDVLFMTVVDILVNLVAFNVGSLACTFKVPINFDVVSDEVLLDFVVVFDLLSLATVDVLDILAVPVAKLFSAVDFMVLCLPS